MTMGTEGMGEMMGMKVPQNSLPMLGDAGPFGFITMSGLLTILKVRENLTNYENPGWYQHPPGTLATLASTEELRRDGINIDVSPRSSPIEHQHPG